MRKTHYLILFITLFCSAFSWAQADIPTGYYYYARGKNKAELKTTLSEISSPLFVLRYGSGDGGTWEGFYQTDRINDNQVMDMYSEVVRHFNGHNSVQGIDIEHSFPKSWWGGHVNVAYRDLHHLYPSDSRTNSAKNNFPLGEITSGITYYNLLSTIGKNSFGTAYSGTAFEPHDEYKGDFARAYMYVATIHEDLFPLWNSPMLNNELYPAWKSWAVDLLLKWHRQDPVSEKEIVRNEVVYGIQGNRNPFIDHPELAEYIWGNRMNENFDYPLETEAFLLSPGRADKINMGVVYQLVEKTSAFKVHGVNITDDLNLSLSSGGASFSLMDHAISAAEANQGKVVELKVTPQSSGVFRDTIVISGGGLEASKLVPVSVIASPDFIVLEADDVSPVGGEIHWLADDEAGSYELSLWQGDVRAGDLIISGYLEGLSNDKAIELYNGTGSAVDLSQYKLLKQTNGAGSFYAPEELNGILPDGQTYLIVHANANDDLKAVADLVSFYDEETPGGGALSFNGNDAVGLFRNDIMIDVVGLLYGGADYYWGQDKLLKRRSEITHPSTQFSLNDWEELPFAETHRLNTHSLNLQATPDYVFQNKNVGSSNTYRVDDLTPETRYTYRVTALRGNERINSVNTQQIYTEVLEAPIALEASDLTPLAFVANWEDHPYTDQYQFDLYFTGGELVELIERFDGVGSSGKPLPEGWTGNVSGNYTSAASSGESPPSVGFKGNQEWLQTPDYPGALNKLSFMCRFASAAAGSSFLVEAQNSSGWTQIDKIEYVNTSKYYPVYEFSQEDDYTAIRFTYNKSSGNFALDDVLVEYGGVDTTYIIQKQAVSGNSFAVQDLPESRAYFYRLRGELQGKFSPWSEQIKVHLDESTGLEVPQSRHLYAVSAGNLILFDLSGSELVRLYKTTGQLVHSAKAREGDNRIALRDRGVYIMQIVDRNGTQSYKLIY